MRLLIIMMMFFLSGISQAQETNKSLIGIWKIDLRPTPEAKEYYQEFEIKTIEKKEITGKFYGSKIKKGLINTEWSKVAKKRVYTCMCLYLSIWEINKLIIR